jgi:hypothetical protein
VGQSLGHGSQAKERTSCRSHHRVHVWVGSSHTEFMVQCVLACTTHWSLDDLAASDQQ